MTCSLTDLPIERGMRLRGLAMTRIETFADAAFAFAVTLLVISVDDVPRSFDEMMTALKSTPVFLFASAQIFIFWLAHRNWSRVYGLDDFVSVILTLLLVVSLLVMVFPLRIVYAFGAADMTGGWIPEPFQLDPANWIDQLRTVFIMLGVSWAWLAAVVVSLYAYAIRRAAHLDLNEAELDNANTYMWIFSVLAFSGVLSIIIAALAPSEWVTLAGYQYFLLFILAFVRVIKKSSWVRRARS
ncbi:MAG: TMEM175 family protein [Gammaproteobacteria bacterium]|nr:TMEM175 family protein [Gammaproteobacteria bacterium]